MRSRYIAGVVIGHLLALPLFADDASYYGDGATVFAAQETRVAMDRENVVVRALNPSADPTHSRWQADCVFTFRNVTDKAVDVQMGFPDWHPFGESGPHGPWAILEFQAFVNDKPVQAVHKNVTGPPDAKAGTPLPKGIPLDYDGAYTWTVHFPPKGTLTVKNSYKFSGFSSAGPFTMAYKDKGFPPSSALFWKTKPQPEPAWDYDDGIFSYVRYIVTTARTWTGPIGVADIAIQIPEGVRPHELVPAPTATSMGGGYVRWHRENWAPDSEITLYRVRPLYKGSDDAPPETIFASVQQAKAWSRFAKANGATRDVFEAMIQTLRDTPQRGRQDIINSLIP